MRAIRVTSATFWILTLLAVGAVQAADPAAGRQVEQSLATSDGGQIPYLIYLPADSPGAAAAKKPLMLFLHGRGESYGPLSLVKKWGPPKRVDLGEHFSYIIVSPQCPTNSSWAKPDQQKRLLELLDYVQRQHPVDGDRIYLTGLSMGGYGSWRLAADHPDKFAAVVPVCGGGDPQDGPKLARLPIWVWHGDKDTAVPLARSAEMVEAIRKAGGTKVRFTTLEDIGHVSWEAAYTAPDLYSWLDQQKASQNRPLDR